MTNSSGSPLVPVYVNQRVVFDLIAMLQGGIATVTKVSEKNRKEASADDEVAATFGLSNAFASLLKIDLSGKRDRSNTDESGTTRDEERVHTPASLFYKLRELLRERSLLKQDDDAYSPVDGDLVEFTSSLQRNPVIEVMMDVLAAMIGLAGAFGDAPDANRPKGKNPKNKSSNCLNR